MKAAGFGVDDREKLPHGVTDSTAALKYDFSDFSAFSGFVSGMGSMFSARRSNRPARFLLVVQADMAVKVLSWRYLGRVWVACCARCLMNLANLTEIVFAAAEKYPSGSQYHISI